MLQHHENSIGKLRTEKKNLKNSQDSLPMSRYYDSAKSNEIFIQPMKVYNSAHQYINFQHES